MTVFIATQLCHCIKVKLGCNLPGYVVATFPLDTLKYNLIYNIPLKCFFFTRSCLWLYHRIMKILGYWKFVTMADMADAVTQEFICIEKMHGSTKMWKRNAVAFIYWTWSIILTFQKWIFMLKTGEPRAINLTTVHLTFYYLQRVYCYGRFGVTNHD